MKKIPTLFERDWNGDRSRVTREVHPGCEWVLAGEGIATRKLDGQCCMVRDGMLFRRRELRAAEISPAGFEQVDFDTESGRAVGWLPIGDDANDQYFRAAKTGSDHWPDGTYELIGPKVQGNAEHQEFHLLIRHGGGLAGEIADGPRDFDDIAAWLAAHDVEGIVWHHSEFRWSHGEDQGPRLRNTPRLVISVQRRDQSAAG